MRVEANTGVRPLLIGEANPYGADPYYALYPWPAEASGGRLCREVLGFKSSATYLRAFDRVNLCPQAWSMKEARERAVWLKSSRPYLQAVLLGAKVREAFRLQDAEPFSIVRESVGRSWYVILPHPSGRNTDWNERGAYDKARALVQTVYPYDLLF